MSQYRGRGHLAIRPCGICSALVLHEEGEVEAAETAERPIMVRRHWRAFPHHAPGGAICIGGGAISRELRRALQNARSGRRRTSDPA